VRSTAGKYAHGRIWGLLFLVLSCSLLLSAQSQWEIETIDEGHGKKVGKFSSLVIGSDGSFHVGYFNATREALWYAFRPAGTTKWFTIEVDASGGYESLALDANGYPHFTYDGPNESGLRYARWDGGKWVRQTIDSEPIEFFNFIRIAPDGFPRISYYHRLVRGEIGEGSYALHLKYASFDGARWYTETVDPRSGTGKFNSLTLDRQGLPNIAYSDVTSGDLCFTRWDGHQWLFSKPDTSQASEGWVGIGSSIEVDNEGNPHIAYVDVAHRSIKYATWTQKNGWKIEVVDHLAAHTADNLDRTSLKLDSRQRPHISYWDSGPRVLRYATLTDQGWKAETVDSSADVGQYSSLALDSHDEVYISYYDAALGVLRMAHRRTAPEATGAQPRESGKQQSIPVLGKNSSG
jgi:hypothetical protein